MDTRGGFGASSSSSSGPRQEPAGRSQQDPFGGPGSRSYWSMYDRARSKAQGTSGQSWQYQQRAEQEFARAHPHYQAAFNQERYRQQFMMTFMKMVPFVAPLWLVILLLGMRRSQPAMHAG